MDKTLTDQVVLVTGSGRGLGRTIVERLAQLGADVAVHDVNREAPAAFKESENLDSVAAGLAQHGVKAVAVTGDIGDEAAVREMVEQTVAALGPITVLVNCAGGDIAASGNGKPDPNDALGISVEDIHAIINRNLVGTMLVCRAVCPAMRDRGAGSVINIASAAAHYGTSPEVAYSVAKAGIVHYTRCLAFELRPQGVRVNAVSPGPTKTARFLATRTTDPELLKDTGLMRYGAPKDIADAVAFFASDASSFISGQVLRVDGGRTLFGG